MKTRPYELYYWPSVQGRGEFVRLALAEAAAPYVDVARLSPSKGGGIPAMMKFLRGQAKGLMPFAPPFLRSGTLVVAQTANILFYLAARHRLVPKGERSRFEGHQLQLTIADVVAEVHETHHPISSGLYYEDQKPEAKRRAAAFVAERIPKYLGYFERVLEKNGGEHLIGDRVSYVDLSMFQLIAGLDYAFPKAMAKMARRIARLRALRARVASRPRIAAYLGSKERIPFNKDGIFRHYPELDTTP